MEQERSAQTIYFKDLFFSVLYKWKWLVIAAVVGGLLLGGVELLTSGVSTTLNPVTLTPEMKEALIKSVNYALENPMNMPE